MPAVDLWSRIDAQFVTTPPPRARAWFALPPTTVGRLGFALTLLLILIGAAWATPGLGDKLFDTLDGLQQVKRAGLTQTIEQSQTIDGVTVTLHEVYADAKRISMGLTIKAADHRHYSIGEVKLVGRNGTSFNAPTISTYSFHPSDAWLPQDWPGKDDTGELGLLYTFHTDSTVGSDGKLDLRLSLSPRPLALVPNEYGEPAWEMQDPKIGPFVFDFSVPLNTDKIVQINHTQRAAGVTMTLKRINVLPASMDAVLCFDQPTPGDPWMPDATLFVDDLDGRGNYEDVLTGADAGCVQQSFDLSSANADGWVLRVDSLFRSSVMTDAKLWTERDEIVGPWEFPYPAWAHAPPPRVLERNGRIDERTILGGVNNFEMTIEPRDGGLMYGALVYPCEVIHRLPNRSVRSNRRHP